MKKLIWGIVFIFVLFTQVNAYADLQIYGYVYDENNEPLKNVKVSTSDNYNVFNYTTDTYGWYSLGSAYIGIKSQKYTFKYEKSGYQSLTKEIDFTTVSDKYSYQVERVTLIKLPSTPTPTPASTPTQTQIDITGNWKGYFSTSLIDSQTISENLKQFKKSVNGTLRTGGTGGGARGIVTGKVNGNIFKFKLKETTKNCRGTFKGTATIAVSNKDTQVFPKNKLLIEGTEFDLRSSTSMYMEFTFTGKDCLGKHKNGEGYLIKQ